MNKLVLRSVLLADLHHLILQMRNVSNPTHKSQGELRTVGEHVERLAVGVHGGEAGGLRGDGAPPLQRRLQRRRPVGHNAQLLAPHGHHLSPLRLRHVGVRLLD